MNALAGKTVLITRAQHQAKQMSVAVQEQSGIPLEIPLLRMEGMSSRQIQHIAEQLHSYDWVIFTSKNGVAFFLDNLRTKLPAVIKIAAVGVKTKLELEKRGYHVHFVPTSFVAEVFAEEFVKELRGNERILFPKGNLARDVIPVKLREFSVFLDELIVYGTKANVEKKQELITALKLGRVNIITFTSPSTVDSFVRLLEGTNWREWTKKCTIACIGPITAKEARSYFSEVIVPEKYTIESLIQCICESTLHA
ncbi:uroporphyrinogen-III synthase [Bacillus cereus]|uniref:uroporphyrinogen-III synthase n=1 Tax=Bacillus cereus TaxID=1396 RepID=UPI0028535E4A|nr:uroporphyrinogen-III synthase [Bacillus cereus]MDR4982889.1 uroporphyrinogen-III synthase [Bacillus cereus]